jgi:homoserine kinase type II
MAVYTSLSQSEVETFISKFNIGKLKSYAGISGGVTNSNFFINTDSCEAVLTIFEELNFEDLDYYFSFHATFINSWIFMSQTYFG